MNSELIHHAARFHLLHFFDSIHRFEVPGSDNESTYSLDDEDSEDEIPWPKARQLTSAPRLKHFGLYSRYWRNAYPPTSILAWLESSPLLSAEFHECSDRDISLIPSVTAKRIDVLGMKSILIDQTLRNLSTFSNLTSAHLVVQESDGSECPGVLLPRLQSLVLTMKRPTYPSTEDEFEDLAPEPLSDFLNALEVPALLSLEFKGDYNEMGFMWMQSEFSAFVFRSNLGDQLQHLSLDDLVIEEGELVAICELVPNLRSAKLSPALLCRDDESEFYPLTPQFLTRLIVQPQVPDPGSEKDPSDAAPLLPKLTHLIMWLENPQSVLNIIADVAISRSRDAGEAQGTDTARLLELEFLNVDMESLPPVFQNLQENGLHIREWDDQ
jgi:hypothetical protein